MSPNDYEPNVLRNYPWREKLWLTGRHFCKRHLQPQVALDIREQTVAEVIVFMGWTGYRQARTHFRPIKDLQLIGSKSDL